MTAIVAKPSSLGFYQGFTSGSDDDIVARFTAKFGRPPAEIVRGSAGSVILAGPVLDRQLEEMRKPHPNQKEIDRQQTELLYAGAGKNGPQGG